jgi:hypothetical protein
MQVIYSEDESRDTGLARIRPDLPIEVT